MIDAGVKPEYTEKLFDEMKRVAFPPGTPTYEQRQLATLERRPCGVLAILEAAIRGAAKLRPRPVIKPQVPVETPKPAVSAPKEPALRANADPQPASVPDTFRHGRLVAPGFEAPKIFVNKQGLLTNGAYTLDQPGMAPHLTGNLASGKSQSFYRLNVQQLTLDAAAYADKAGLWIGNKAKVKFDGPIGVHAGTGKPTSVLNLYRSSTGHVHSAPGTPE